MSFHQRIRLIQLYFLSFDHHQFLSKIGISPFFGWIDLLRLYSCEDAIFHVLTVDQQDIIS